MKDKLNAQKFPGNRANTAFAHNRLKIAMPDMEKTAYSTGSMITGWIGKQIHIL